MARLQLLVLCLGLVFWMSACGSKSTVSEETTTNTTEMTHDHEGSHEGHSHESSEATTSSETGTEEASTEEKKGKEHTSAFVCPMHCEGSGAETAGSCPACGMAYVENSELKK